RSRKRSCRHWNDRPDEARQGARGPRPGYRPGTSDARMDAGRSMAGHQNPRYTISRAVRGANVLSPELIEKVAKALKLDPDDIVRAAERSSLDDMPTGVMSTPLV